MKNGYISLLIILASFFLVGCETPSLYSNTPDEDSTMLWPACDSTGFWGFINEKGEMVIPAKFERTYGFSGGMAKVVIDEDGVPMPPKTYREYYEGHQQAFVDIHGNVLFALPNDKAFTDNYCYYGCCRYEGMGFQGMMDHNFNAFIPVEQYGRGLNLGVMTKDGLASSSLGYFNRSGKLAISAYINGKDGKAYEYLGDFCDGIAVVGTYTHTHGIYGTIDKKYGAINTRGKIVIDTIYRYLRSVGNDRLVYKLNDSVGSYVGLMDTRGNIITEESILVDSYVSFFGDGGLMPVRELDDDYPIGYNYYKYGYVDINGTLQIPYQYSSAEPFCNGYAWVKAPNDKNEYVSKLINLQGQVVLELELFQEPASFISGNYHNGLCLIFDTRQYPSRYHYMNLKGEIICSWPQEPIDQQNSAPGVPKHMQPDFKEQMLQHFEGTPYYPLALQCAQTKD